MSKTDRADSGFLSGFLLLLLIFSLLISLLPLHQTYKENISLLFLMISISILGCSLKLFFVDRSRRSTNKSIITLLVVFLFYLLIQILPIPMELMSRVSEYRADIWQSNAYGLKGYATLSLDITASIWFLILFFCYLCLFVLTAKLVTTEKTFFILVLILFCFGLYQIFFDLISKSLGYQYISPTEIDGHTYRLTGTFINSNNLSALINISIAAGMALLVMLVQNRLVSNKSLNLFLIVTVIAGEILLFYGSIKSGSAGGFLSLLAAIGLVSLLVLLRRFNFLVLFSFFGISLCIAGLLTFYGSRELNIEELTHKLTLSGRPALWAAVIDMWKDFPLFGIGAGAFEWMFPSYKGDQLSLLRVVNAHSSYLNILVETGLIGVLILMMILYCYLYSIIKLVRNNPSHLYLAGALMVGWLAFIIHEAVENNLLLPSVAAPFFCLMAMVLSLANINFSKGD